MHVVSNVRIQTNRYLNMSTRYLEPRSAITLRDFRTIDRERLIEDMANEYALTCTILAHIKAFLSRPSDMRSGRV